ncbi:MAG: amidohydrolase family protein [Dinoroseobacter sp.]|nr:amidohydrolase family protein [Dinoroseobacter sp.]
MKIDAHHHLWNLSAVFYPWLEARGVRRFFGDPSPIQQDYLIDTFRRDAEGIQASVHIQVGAADPWEEAQWVQSVADATPDWPLVQVAFCDLTAPDTQVQLDRLQALSSLRGVRQIVGRAPEEDAATGTNALLDDPAFSESLKQLAARGLSFDLQLIPELYGAMAHVLDAAPHTHVALCHAGSPHDRTVEGLLDWEQQLKTLSERPQVTCKLSGLGMFDHNWTVERIRPIVEICLDQFGPDRCMFGSNFPVDSLYGSYAKTREAIEMLIPKRDHAQVFGATAARFYRFQ